jgi:hypothetical protein
MHIVSPEEERIVDDYDFYYSSGVQSTVVVDGKKGDTISFGDSQITVKLTSKKVRGAEYPDEEITIFKSKLDSYAHRTRKVTDLSKEQEEDWINIVTKMSKTVN